MHSPIISQSEAWGIGISLMLMALDILSGVCKAIASNSLSSSVMREGLWHKAGFIGILVLATVIDIGETHVSLGFDIPVLGPTAIYICLTEVTSIVENLGELSPELRTSGILKIFSQDKRQGEDDDSDR